eukprot:TRINITY_DN6550_c0_g2_i2.p1 TRINITY_DN6550_c0_g2~~TRINITY_DN6550_c0_g2_i2.p1  ORF type:complete len:194 (+),score=42.02 TRINITY_DN6550_c0_g2_i2:209-790(+)
MHHKKITINSALGFDTFMVMRHGVPVNTSLDNSDPVHSERLGCYFCNDVVAPRDSLTDRTLDQQCTVTRPGLSFIASSLAVELAVSLLTHPLGVHAPAEEKKDLSESTSTELGIVPHQIRGYLTHYLNLIVTGRYYNRCVGCSDHILEEYHKKGLEFIYEVLTNPVHLEDVTGISKMKDQQLDMEWENDDDDF